MPSSANASATCEISSGSGYGDTVSQSSPTQRVTVSRVIDTIGLHRYQVLCVAILSLANVADAVEVYAIGYALENVSAEWSLTPAAKGFLTSIIFVGMAIGGLLFGCLSDVLQRKVVLMFALAVNAASGLLSAFSPSFSFLAFFRFSSGFGVGASIPVMWPLIYELMPLQGHSVVFTVVALAWNLGSLLSSMLALAVYGLHPAAPDKEVLAVTAWGTARWRIYLACAAIPAALASVLIAYVPLSPQQLAARGETKRSLDVLRTIARRSGVPDVFHWSTLHIVSCEHTERASDLQAQSPPAEECRSLHSSKDAASADADEVLSLISEGPLEPAPVASPPLWRVVWQRLASAPLVGLHQIKALGAYWVPFVILAFVWFFLSFGFYALAEWLPSFFLLHPSGISPYLSTFLVALASLPGSILTLVVLKFFGGLVALLASLVASAISLAPFAVASSGGMVLFLNCLFAFSSTGGWTALNIVESASFPITVRGTAFGLHAAFGRLGAIVGNVAFAYLEGTSAATETPTFSSNNSAWAASGRFYPEPSALPLIVCGVSVCISAFAGLFLLLHTRLSCMKHRTRVPP